MSILDSFFNKGFKAAKCKTLLKLTIPRIKLIRNRREAQIKQMRREIAKLLETGQEATARIRVEHIIREEKMMAAQEIIELFCELIAVRLPIIEAQRECPLDLKEAISSICFAAPRCSDLTELQQVQLLFVSKYGKEFVAAASELKPDSGVNRKLVELLSVRAPSPETKLKLLKEIAEEHQLDWDPTPTETDLFKSHEDLLDGPKQFGGGSKVPLKEEQDKASHLTMLSLSRPEEEQRQSDSDSEYEELDFPEVPNVLLRPTPESAAKPAATYEQHTSPDLPSDSENAGEGHLTSKRDEQTAKASSTVVEGQRHSTESDPVKQNSYSPPSAGVVGSFSTNESESAPRKISDGDLRDVLTAAQAAADSAERAAAAARSAASLAQLRINELTKKTPDQSPESPTENPFFSSHAQQTMEKPQFDHQNSSVSSYGDHTEFQMEGTSSLFSHQAERLPSMEKPQFDHQNSSASSYGDLTDFQLGDYSSPFNHQAGRLPSMEKPRFDHQNSSVSSYGDITELQRPETSSFDRLSPDQDHQQMRLPSREDDPYYSYPNLFTSQNPDRSPGSRSFSDTSKPAHDS
ncbi:Regulator of Vps4 activity in the MVB pathway protein [Hirschfeldia incana]|nr:Regulator of Vps4 activity in the MVB pathway protein [Hirschfeldia incana]